GIGARGPPLRRAARAHPRAGDGRVRSASSAGRCCRASLAADRPSRGCADKINTHHETKQETTMTLRRRTVLRAGAVAGTAVLAGFAANAFAQARTKLRVGYLHTPAVDGQIWLGQQSGAWSKRGLDLELIQFTTGLELFQAMIGGSLDVLSTGAVVSN